MILGSSSLDILYCCIHLTDLISWLSRLDGWITNIIFDKVIVSLKLAIQIEFAVQMYGKCQIYDRSPRWLL